MFSKDLLSILLLLNFSNWSNAEEEVEESNKRFKIEGRVAVQGEKPTGNIFDDDSCWDNCAMSYSYRVIVRCPIPTDWTSQTTVLANGGEYIGFLKADGSFIISDVASGSYIVEVASPNYLFEAVRVDISAKRGKIRARKVNFLQNSAVVTLPYPLKFKTKEPAQFFELRDTWHWKDFLFNPMVLMMVLPLFLLLLLPKLMGQMDPETQKEMSSMNMFNQSQEMPEFSDMLTNWFSSGQSKKKASKAITKKSPPGRRR